MNSAFAPGMPPLCPTCRHPLMLPTPKPNAYCICGPIATLPDVKSLTTAEPTSFPLHSARLNATRSEALA